METQGQHGWVGYTSGPGGKDHLPPEVRAEVERQEALLIERRGRLLCEVVVRVYEHDTASGVGFPPGSALDVESDPHEVTSAVARARDALTDWR
jgi:hypothetical protein